MSRKLALIIGNNDYSNKPLKNCVNDATSLANVLRGVENCHVELRTNLKSDNMYDCINDFIESIRRNDFVIFFFAGHGIQWGDQNFLLPCDNNKIRSGDDMQRYAINAQSTVNRMADMSPHIVLFLLDCCRNYWIPIKTSNNRAQDQQVGGLNQMKAPRQTLIAFACAAGEVVSDQFEGSNSGLFTKYLLKHITTPNEHIETILRRVANDVVTITDNSQIPFRVSSIISDEVYLVTKVETSWSMHSTNSPLSNHTAVPLHAQLLSHPGIVFGLSSSNHGHIQQLFEYLNTLPPMDKNRSMNGDCDYETSQMERFLSKTFDFKNIPGQVIVHGVKSFILGKLPQSMAPTTEVSFPYKAANPFAMTVQEIIDWQQSYRVYADKNVTAICKSFLKKALQGLSDYGEEAFRMKFVVRISQCPILMEFDARIIPRQIADQWPHKITLVSVTGIDFAGRIHDVNDIRTYVSNWQDVYEIDPRTHLPRVYDGRDFHRRPNGPRATLHQKLLLNDLIRMARLRLRACDAENVQIVVETGIGLGVFAGKYIGIDETVRELSASAIRTVLEEDGPRYQNILGVVFALPIFDGDISNDRRQDTYQAFANEFHKSKYQGCIPVLIADQDMHRLTVAIARAGFIVSELNPADSHGVFGEYWQNRGPAVEEKLALTTLGLLVQHHLINPNVLDSKNYFLM